VQDASEIKKAENGNPNRPVGEERETNEEGAQRSLQGDAQIHEAKAAPGCCQTEKHEEPHKKTTLAKPASVLKADKSFLLRCVFRR